MRNHRRTDPDTVTARDAGADRDTDRYRDSDRDSAGFRHSDRDGAGWRVEFAVTDGDNDGVSALGIEVADGPDEEFYEAAYHDPELSLGTPTPPPSLFTGLVEEQIDGAHRENIDVTVRQTQPFPVAILSIIPKFETHGN